MTDTTPQRTGDDAVDAVIATLEQIGPGTPLEQQVVLLDDAHGALQRRLTATPG